MADHDVSSQNPMASLRAFTAPLFRGLTAAIVVFIIYAFVNGGSGGSTSSTSSESGAAVSPGASAPGVVTNVLPSVDPSTGALVNPTASNGALIGGSEGTMVGDKPGVGVKVQVLQGASTSKSSFESAVSRLKQLGYTVKTGGKASKDYDTTTVFVVKGKETEADNLKAADPRFKELKDKPDSITAKDDVHVVVGSDWVAASGEGSSSSSSSESASEGTSSRASDGASASANPSASASASASGTAGTTGSYDPSTSAALPAGAQGAAVSNTVPNFAGAAANTSNVNTTGTTPGTVPGTVVNPSSS